MEGKRIIRFQKKSIASFKHWDITWLQEKEKISTRPIFSIYYVIDRYSVKLRWVNGKGAINRLSEHIVKC